MVQLSHGIEERTRESLLELAKKKKKFGVCHQAYENGAVKSKAVCFNVSKGTAMVTNLQQRKLFEQTLAFFILSFSQASDISEFAKKELGMKRG